MVWLNGIYIILVACLVLIPEPVWGYSLIYLIFSLLIWVLEDLCCFLFRPATFGRGKNNKKTKVKHVLRGKIKVLYFFSP